MFTPSWRRRVAVAAVLVLAALGYAIVPPQSAGAQPKRVSDAAGVVLGHVATARAQTSATIVIGPGGAVHGFKTRSVTISKGASLKVVNKDTILHTVTSRAQNSNGVPLFDTSVPAGQTVSITAASGLAPGKYAFYCRIHPQMTGTLTVEGASGGTHPAKVRFRQPLVLPKVLTGKHVHITIKRAKVRVLPTGPRTLMWTYGGSYPGPTIRRPVGRDTKVTYVNRLPASTGSVTVHLHGDHHSSANDGQPTTQLIKPGKRRTYNYPLTDGGKPEPAAFDFYHDHRMDETSRNNWNGLQGMFITDAKNAHGLPAGKYDVPLLVSDRSFTANNQLTEPFPATPSMAMTGPSAPPGDGTVGTRILVDGRYAPYLKVGTHHYRLRLLNGSNFQSYDFALSDHRSFVQVGTGNALLPKPVRRHDILLGPAQRADVIVDFGGELHKNVVLKSIARTDHSPRGIGTASASIMQFRVRTKVRDTTRVPATLEKPPAISAPAKVAATWTFGLGGDTRTGTYWTVNGKPFDPKRVDLKVPLGSTQTWLLKNDSSITHYIHIHEEQWHTIRRDGKAPPKWERGLEDTWRLDPGESVKVAAKFTDYTGVFMIHCHMLDHEDHGMMAQFAVVKRGSKALPAGYYFDRSASAAAMDVGSAPMSMSMADSMSMQSTAPLGGTAAATARWSRVLERALRALVIELIVVAAVALLLGSRRRYLLG